MFEVLTVLTITRIKETTDSKIPYIEKAKAYSETKSNKFKKILLSKQKRV